MAQGNNGSTPRLRPDKRMFPTVEKKLREEKKDESPTTSKESITKSICTGTVREVLKGGLRVQPQPSGNSEAVVTKMNP